MDLTKAWSRAWIIEQGCATKAPSMNEIEIIGSLLWNVSDEGKSAD